MLITNCDSLKDLIKRNTICTIQDDNGGDWDGEVKVIDRGSGIKDYYLMSNADFLDGSGPSDRGSWDYGWHISNEWPGIDHVSVDDDLLTEASPDTTKELANKYFGD